MTTTPALPPSALHPRADGFTHETRGSERRIGLLFASTGLGLVATMGVLGLLMRLTQATVIGLSPAWFYRLMTLHGSGMIVGTLLVMMGALWYVLRATVPLRTGRMLVSYGLTVGGAGCVVVATLARGFGAGWTFLPPLPFYPVGQWPVWSEGLFFVGNLVVGSGFFVYCFDVLEQTTTAYGGLTRALGWQFLLGREDEAPPPEVIAAVVVAIDGLLSMAAGMAIVAGLVGRTYDSSVGFDASGAGPGLEGLAGGTTTLANGQTVSADDAYIVRSIVDPDAEIVKGYHAGLMSAAISSRNLKNKPNDVLALAAFIKSHR
jgi:hypothetical protein